MSAVTLDRPWLTFDLGARMQVLSWAIDRPGFVHARRVLWREVRDADLPRGLDVRAWLGAELAARGEAEAVTFVTSRDVATFEEARAAAGGAAAHCVATVGLSNAERVGTRRPVPPSRAGTINVALRLDRGLSRPGLIEALTIAAQARTAAILELALDLPGIGRATGTGTDCIALAAPEGGGDHAGLHTDAGEAIGAAVFQAVRAGGARWMAEHLGGA